METVIRLHDEEFMKDLSCITMTTKGQFKDSGHIKSDRYYIPEVPMLSRMGMSSGLFLNLTLMANFYTCTTIVIDLFVSEIFNKPLSSEVLEPISNNFIYSSY